MVAIKTRNVTKEQITASQAWADSICEKVRCRRALADAKKNFNKAVKHEEAAYERYRKENP